MSISLRYSDQRFVLLCNRAGCLAHIVASEAAPQAQLAELETTATMLGWRRTQDAGDYCETHAVELPEPEYPVVPREELCPLDTWCIRRAGHADACKTVPRVPREATDFGPRAAVRTRRVP